MNSAIQTLLTRQHIGLLLTVLGTILLALSLKIIKQMGNGVQTIGENGKIISPSETSICRSLFWSGLTCIAIGTLLQW